MVAKSTIWDRFVRAPDAFAVGRLRVARFTRADLDVLLREHIVPEDASTELLDGMIVLKDRSTKGEDPLTIGYRHTQCVERLSDLRSRINAPSRHVRSQQPLVCSETHAPEPDFMVLRGTLDDYSDRPVATDAFCVVEVADASYELDSTYKMVSYARAGIQQYVVVNLVAMRIEVYEAPGSTESGYQRVTQLQHQDVLELRIGGNETLNIPVSAILP